MGLVAMLTTCSAEPFIKLSEMPEIATLTAQQQKALVSWVDQVYPDLAYQEQLKFTGAAVDLNADGRDEVIARLENNGFCGSGGCHLVVLEPGGVKYRAVGNITLSRFPIYVLNTRHRGWLDLGVSVRHDYISSGLSRMPFDGEFYAGNPTMPPASPAVATSSKLLVLYNSAEALK